MKSPYEIVIAEDHTILRQGLRALLSTDSDLEVVGEAEDGRAAVRLVETLSPALLLMDLSMPRMTGMEAITELGTSVLDVGSEADMISDVINQAKTAENYMDTTADTRFKGYFIFQWQNANWKGGSGVADSFYGIHNYDGSLCTSVTGPYKGNQPQDSTEYDVDRLVQKTSAQYPDGLLNELAKIFD